MEASCMVGFYDHDEKMKMIMMKMGSRSHHIDDEACMSESSTSSLFDSESNTSTETSASGVLDDDASSSSSSNNGPLYELSELMDQLPIKRGLSKFYQGKSQSFTAILGRVTSLKDLAKKESPYQRKLKGCKSYGGGLSSFKSYTQPKGSISKKAHSNGSFSNLSCSTRTRNGSFIGSPRRSPMSRVNTN